MNQRQQRTLLAGAATVTAMLLFPPWLYFDPMTSNQKSAGYHLLSDPPAIKTYEEMFGIAGDDVLTTRLVRVSNNRLRLVTQLIIAIFFTIGMAIRFGGRPSRAFAFCMASAILGTVFFILLGLTKY